MLLGLSPIILFVFVIRSYKRWCYRAQSKERLLLAFLMEHYDNYVF